MIRVILESTEKIPGKDIEDISKFKAEYTELDKDTADIKDWTRLMVRSLRSLGFQEETIGKCIDIEKVFEEN